MSKPLGISLTMKSCRPTAAEDKIWDAVEEVIMSGMTAQQFKLEAAAAWKEISDRLRDDAIKELLR